MITNPVFIDLVSAITPKPRIVCEYCIHRQARLRIRVWDVIYSVERYLIVCVSCSQKAIREAKEKHSYQFRGFTYL